MRFSCLIVFFICFGCGEDPILVKVNSEQAETSSKKKSVDSVSKEETVQSDIPLIAPPKTSPKTPIGQLPKVAPPTVEPPQEHPQEAVPPPPPNPKDGDFITIKGSINASNPTNKAIRIDIFDGDQRNIGGKRPSVVVSKTVDSGPKFEIFLPKKDQQLWIGAYIDEDEDGRPGPMDPSGWYSGNPVLGSSNSSDITLILGIPNDAPP